ncbi:hypothetical protein LTR95_015196 [Oleoguttula sp. CCFEE 5521]
MPNPSRSSSSIGGSMRRKVQSWRSARHDIPFHRPHPDRDTDGGSDDEETIFPFDETVSLDERFAEAGSVYKRVPGDLQLVALIDANGRVDNAMKAETYMVLQDFEDEVQRGFPTWVAVVSDVVDIMLIALAMAVEEVHWVASIIVLANPVPANDPQSHIKNISLTMEPLVHSLPSLAELTTLRTPSIAWKTQLRIISDVHAGKRDAALEPGRHTGGVIDLDLVKRENALIDVFEGELRTPILGTGMIAQSIERVRLGIVTAEGVYERVLEQRREEGKRVEMEKLEEEKRSKAAEMDAFFDTVVKPRLDALKRREDEWRATVLQLQEDRCVRLGNELERVVNENALLAEQLQCATGDYQALVYEHQQLLDEHQLLQQQHWKDGQQLADLQLRREME